MFRGLIRTPLVLAAFACAFGAFAAPASPAGAPPRKPRTLSFSIVYKLASGGQKGSLTLWSMVPRTIPGVQEVISLDCTPKAESITEVDGERVAEFEIPDLPNKCEVKIRVKIKIWPHDLQAATRKAKRGKKKKKRDQQPSGPSAKELAPWLEAGPGFDLEAPAVKSLLRRIRAKTDIGKVRQIHSVIQRKLEPKEFEGKYAGAAAAIKAGKGDVVDYTDLFVTLCRARGVPARFVEGLTIPFFGGAEYAWPEVYLEGHGWVYFDPLSVEYQGATFERIDNRFIKLSNHRGSPALEGEHYWRYAYAGESMTIKTEVVVH